MSSFSGRYICLYEATNVSFTKQWAVFQADVCLLRSDKRVFYKAGLFSCTVKLSHFSAICMINKKDQNTQEVRFLISTGHNNVPIFGIRCLSQSDKRTNSYKTRKGEFLFSWMSLLKIAVEQLPPSQRSSLEIVPSMAFLTEITRVWLL